MTFTYSGDPSKDSLNEVRFLIGDTNETNPLFQDEEINYLINQSNGNSYLAASLGASQLATKFAQLVDKSMGDLSISYSQRSTRFETLSKELLSKAQTYGSNIPSIYAGGISVDDKETVELDTDRVEPIFKRDMHKNNQEY